MTTFLSGVAVGIVIGALLFYRVGEAITKAKRAWRDLISAKNDIRGLWRRVRAEAARAIRYALVGAGLILGAVTVAYLAVMR